MKNVDIAGGKGASLGEMSNQEIPVPEGFVVLSNAFDRFIEETNLKTQIKAVLDKVNNQATHTAEFASEKIQSLILAESMPDDLKEQILTSFKILNCKFVAVRSSATSEDSSDAAWAGQLNSYLNTTKEDLFDKVKHCWASLFTPRAIFYRFEKKLQNKHISVAVVIQKMIESEKSGIAFSVHPVTEDYNQLIIESGFGLGEAIVSGSITPDSYIISKKPLEIIEEHISDQTRALFKGSLGGVKWKDINGSESTLSEKEVLELSKLIMKVEEHYGFPVDVEWAYENGNFYIVQSRPITTLKK
jgi:pyruvate,water dikinase